MNTEKLFPAACSAMQLTSKEGSPYWARTCDIHESLRDAGAHSVNVPKGQTLSFAHGTLSACHAFCGITFDRRDTWLLDGINDAGLTGGLLMLSEGTGLPQHEKGIMGMEFVSAMLSQCSSVEDVLRAAEDVFILNIPYGEHSVPPTMHYYFLDITGANLVLEAADPLHPGKLTAYRNSIGILTNSPPYPQQLSNLRRFLSASPELNAAGISTLSFEHTELSADPHAAHISLSGTFPASFASCDRFIRAAVFKALNHCGKQCPDHAMLPLAAGLMQPLFEPENQGVFHYDRINEKGLPTGNKQSHTQYTVIYDLTKRQFAVQSSHTLAWKSIALIADSRELYRDALFSAAAEPIGRQDLF